MSDVLYELTIESEGPHSTNIRMECDDLDIQEWASVIQNTMDQDDFLQVYCIRSESWHVFKGGSIVHFSIRQLSKAKIQENIKKLESVGWPKLGA